MNEGKEVATRVVFSIVFSLFPTVWELDTKEERGNKRDACIEIWIGP